MALLGHGCRSQLKVVQVAGHLVGGSWFVGHCAEAQQRVGVHGQGEFYLLQGGDGQLK